MNEHNINLSLRDRVKKYLEFLWKLKMKNINREQNLINKLPKTLKEEILSESLGKDFQNFSILQKNFSTEFLKSLVTITTPMRFSPNEIIHKVK